MTKPVNTNALIDKAKYEKWYKESVENPDKFWGKHGKRIDRFKPYTKVKNTFFTGKVSTKWYEDCLTNVSYMATTSASSRPTSRPTRANISPATLPPRRGWLLLDHRPPFRHGRSGIGARLAQSRLGGRRRRLSACDQGAGHLLLCGANGQATRVRTSCASS